MTRFFLLLILFFSLSWLLLTYGGVVFYPAFSAATSNYRFLVIIIAAASYPLYTYTDGIQKDVIADFGPTQAGKAIEKIESLKKEILVNIFALFLLLVFQILSSSVRQALTPSSSAPPDLAQSVLLASEVACFLMGVTIGVIQFLGFLQASEFRSATTKQK